MRRPGSCWRTVGEKESKEVEIKLKLSLCPTENGKAWTKCLQIGVLWTPSEHSIERFITVQGEKRRGL